MLRFKGSQNFRQRLLFATLSGRAVRIDDIRAGDQEPGLRDFEASLLRLLEKLSNGCVVEINETGARAACGQGRPRRHRARTRSGRRPAPAAGSRRPRAAAAAAGREGANGWREMCASTASDQHPIGARPRPHTTSRRAHTSHAQHTATGTSLRYKPGVLVGGGGHVHDCPCSRGVGYFLEPLLLLALFCKRPVTATLRGVTNDALDVGVDTFRAVTLPLMKRLGVEDGLELRVVRRGAAPLGGGEVEVRVPQVKALPAISLTDEGMIKRVRGVAYSMKVRLLLLCALRAAPRTDTACLVVHARQAPTISS